MEETADFVRSNLFHLLSWCDLRSEMIDRCIKKGIAMPRNHINQDRQNSGNSVGNYKKLHYPVLNEAKTNVLNDILDVIVSVVSTDLSSGNPLEFQIDKNSPLEKLVAKFNDLRRRELLYIETAIHAAIERQTSIIGNLQYIKCRLEMHSKIESTRPEIEYIQTFICALLKKSLIMVGKGRQKTLDIETVFQIPYNRDIQPELKRLVTMVSSHLDLKDDVDTILTGPDLRQKLRYINGRINVNLDKLDTLADMQLIENIYAVINPVLDHIKAAFDAGQEIESIKDAINMIERKNNIVVDEQKKTGQKIKCKIDKVFNKMEVMLEIPVTVINAVVRKVKRQIYGIIDSIGWKIDTWVEACEYERNIIERKIIRHILDTVDTMLEKYYKGVDTQREKQQIIDVTKTMLDTMNMRGVDARREMQQITITLVDAKQEIQGTLLRSMHLMQDKIRYAYGSQQGARYTSIFSELEQFDAEQNMWCTSILSIYDDTKDMLNRIGKALDSRRETREINENVNTILGKITTKSNTRQTISHIFHARDSFSTPCVDELQCLHDIRIILDNMLETFYTNERQLTHTTCTWMNEERRLAGTLTAVQIMLSKDYSRAGERYKNDLKCIQNVVHKMTESLVQKQTELQDIQTSVCIMLDRIAAMVNERGRFLIARIDSCGSKAEHTSVWKHDETNGEKYTESDFLAILDYSPEIYPDNGCRGLCVEVRGLLRLSTEIADASEKEAISGLKARYDERVMLDRLFWKELHTCLGSACDCFTVEFDELNPWYRVSYKSPGSCETEHHSLCCKCAVEMPTGILNVNGAVSLGGPEEANCSLSFIWTSKANTLFARDKLLEKSEGIESLSIYVDFLPALEVLKPGTDETAHEHDYFLVPKHCDVCDRNKHWRKSNCMAEIAFINNEMSEKHRNSYKILKYCLSTVIDKHGIDINWYHVKTVALNHSRECPNISEGCAECVLKMLTELKHAYETKTLNTFHEPDVNMIGPFYQSSYTDTCVSVLEQFIKRLCWVTETASFDALLRPL